MPALNPEKKCKSNCSKSNLPKIHKKSLSPTEGSQPQISIKSTKTSKSTRYKSKMPALNPEKKSKSNCSKSNLPKIHKKSLSPTERSQPQISIKFTRNKSKVPAKKSKSTRNKSSLPAKKSKSTRNESKMPANPEGRVTPLLFFAPCGIVPFFGKSYPPFLLCSMRSHAPF